MKSYQQLLVLYLKNSSLDSDVIAWSFWDGSGEKKTFPGDSNEKPYKTGLDTLTARWRLIQMSPIYPTVTGSETTTSIFQYEFIFEKLLTEEP